MSATAAGQPSRTDASVYALWFAVVAQAAVTAAYSLTRFYELKISGYDGALFTQLLTNFNNGYGLTTSILFDTHWFGVHFSPILYLLAPLFHLFPSLKFLLLLKSALFALAAVPIFYAARNVLQVPLQALMVALFYLFNPFVFNAGIWDFQEIAFAPLCIATALWALTERSRVWFLGMLCLLMTVKEHYGLAVFGFGLLWAYRWREKTFGFTVAIIGLAGFALIVFVIMPSVSISGGAAMLDPNSDFSRYAWILEADNALVALVLFGAFLYVLILMLPFWLLPFGALLWLFPGMADFITNGLSRTEFMRSNFSYHSAALIPIIVIAYTQVLARFPSVAKALSRRDILAVTAFSTIGIAVSDMGMALPINDNANVWEFSGPQLSYTAEDKKALERIDTLLPDNMAVAAQDNVLPHLRVHRTMRHFPDTIAKTDLSQVEAVVLHTGFPYADHYAPFASPYSVRGSEYFDAVKKLFVDKSWSIVFFEHHWLVLRRHGKDDAKLRAEAMNSLHNTEILYMQIKKQSDAKHRQVN